MPPNNREVRKEETILVQFRLERASPLHLKVFFRTCKNSTYHVPFPLFLSPNNSPFFSAEKQDCIFFHSRPLNFAYWFLRTYFSRKDPSYAQPCPQATRLLLRTHPTLIFQNVERTGKMAGITYFASPYLFLSW